MRLKIRGLERLKGKWMGEKDGIENGEKEEKRDWR